MLPHRRKMLPIFEPLLYVAIGAAAGLVVTLVLLALFAQRVA